MLWEVKKAGLWSDIDIHVVGSPISQQDTVPKMSKEAFEKILSKEKPVSVPSRDELVKPFSLLQNKGKARKIE